MMGLGYLGSSSSSSSSSNLSPLAPPFTVDRSNHNKPVLNSNPIPHFSDPSYGVPFTSSWPYSHSSTARQEFSADSPRTTALPSNDCGYMISEPVNLPTTGNWSGLNSNGKHGSEQITPGRSHWSAVYPTPKRVTDSFSYNLSESKPFYPPYASSAANNDDVPLVTFSEPSYDLLSTSGLVHAGETSQVDYTRSLSGLEYNPQQEGVWSGLPEGKQVKKLESDDSFFSEKAPIAVSLAYNNYLNQGAYGSESLSKSKDDSSLFYYADIIKRANNSGPVMNGKSDGGSAFRAFPMFSESHPLIQSPEDPWNSQISYYEKRYHMFDCSDSKSSPLVIKPKSYNLSALNINDIVGKEEEQSSSNQLSFQIGRTDDVSANDQPNFEFKARPSFQVPEMMSIPNVKTSENVKSSANSFEQFDHHNPAEDSPCWKGAPTSQFLPFGSSEPESPQPPMKKLQTGNGVDLQTDYSFKNSSGPDVDVGAKGSNESVGDTMKGHGSSNLQTPNKLKQPNPEVEINGDIDAKNVNASILVKSLYTLSDLLLLHCSNDKFALKQHDHEALDHVIGNLGVCMSTVPQQQKTSEEGGKNASLRVEADPPKDDNMIQAIKKVLDENVECCGEVEVPLLYKNLWLEAEAELCSLSFRSRFERLKREMSTSNPAAAAAASSSYKKIHSSLSDASAIKEISSCKASADPKVEGSIDEGVMARFNILKQREEPRPANVEGREVAEIDDDVMARLNILKRREEPFEVAAGSVVGKDVEAWVMDRINILKCSGKQGAHFQDEEEEDEEEEAVGSGGSDWEHVLKDEFGWRLS